MISHVHAGIGNFDRASAFYATVLEGVPGLRRHRHAHHCGAYFRNPDGNKLGVCCHQPEPS